MESKKRIRSTNWDEDEKQLLRLILKEYTEIIERKTLDFNSTKKKNKAWEEVHKKFNELNGRPRELSQLKVQWKTMKINARKTFSSFQKEAKKTGGGARPKSPDDSVAEVIDLLNPAELLTDMNTFDCDCGAAIPSTSKSQPETSSCETCRITEQDSKPLIITSVNQSGPDIIIETIEDVDEQVDSQKLISCVVSQDDTPIITDTPKNKNLSTGLQKEIPRRKLKNSIIERSVKSRKDTHGDYVNMMISHSKILKDEEHLMKMEMAREEHAIKMQIHRQKLQSAILETQILELKKAREELA